MSTTPQTLQNDQDLIVSIVKKDKIAFSSLYDKYAKAIFGIIYGITGDEHLSEELLQRSFCLIWSMAADYQPAKQRLFTWMIRIAGNLAKESLALPKNEIQDNINYVNDSKESNKFGLVNSKGLLELIFIKGNTLQEAVKKSGCCEEDLKYRLHLECNSIRD